MSDPVKSVEMEDVLSSIRRLVSEDNRPAEAAKAGPAAAQDRLVLTPALRVMDDPETDENASRMDEWDNDAAADLCSGDADDVSRDADAPFVAIDAEDASFQDPSFKDQPMSIFAAMRPQETNVASGHAETGAADQSDAAENEASLERDDQSMTSGAEPEGGRDGEAFEDASPQGNMDMTADSATDESDEDMLSTLVKRQSAAVDEADVAASDIAFEEESAVEPQAEAEGVSFDEETPDTVQADTVEAGIAQDVEPEAVVEAELMEAEQTSIGHTAEAASLSSKIAALEAVIGGRDDHWDPDDAGDSDYSGTEDPTMVWDDPDAEVTADAAAAEPASATQPDEPLDLDMADVLDEETLREMVSDIVREELQGALGERITRNVRKLVRREIHRAMAAQELE